MKKGIIFLIFFAVIRLNAQPEAVFAHGFWDYPEQVEQYKNLFPCSLRAFSFPEVKSGWINPLRANMAQEEDVKELASACEGTSNLLLMGLSRGASTIATYLGTHKHDHIKAAILESPFDKLESVVDSVIVNRLHLGWVPGLARLVKLSLPWFFWGYQRGGVRPVDVVDAIRTDLPILLVCSLQDSLVPVSSSQALYKRLQETGHKHAYMLVLDHGKHSKVVLDEDFERYQKVVHAFCRRYDLPFDEALADQGEQDLDTCQPAFS